MAEYDEDGIRIRAGSVNDSNRCRHDVPGGCDLDAFPDDAFATFYTGTTIRRTSPSRFQIDRMNETVFEPRTTPQEERCKTTCQ